jgi:tetratricopeptide (TPR) repeat protein
MLHDSIPVGTHRLPPAGYRSIVTVASPSTFEPPRILAAGDVLVDLARLAVMRGGEVLRLTRQEGALLLYLHERPGQIVSRQELLQEVWRYRADIHTRAVDNAISRLRQKIDTPGQPTHLRCAYGGGYVLVDMAPAPPPVLPDPSPAALAQDPTRFFGRTEELRSLSQHLLASAGPVSVTGAPGLGKSRLVREIVRACAPSLGQRVWWLDLAESSTSDPLLELLGRALRVAPTVQGLGAMLAAQSGLLVIDNVDLHEQRVEQVLELWLQQAPALRVLAIGRARLGRVRAHVLELGPLAPSDALQMLLERAEQVGVRLHPSAPETLALLQKLEGFPLAIELAAAQLALEPTAQLLQRLSSSTGLLDGALGASWELLGEGERRVLGQLAVFCQGFDLEAADSVLDAGSEDPGAVLQRLCERSLVRRVWEGGLVRFQLYDSVRSFVRRKLPDQAPAEQRHARHYLGWILAEGDALLRGQTCRFGSPLPVEADNVRLAIRTARTFDPLLAARAAAAFAACAAQDGGVDVVESLCACLGDPLPRPLALRLQFAWADLRFRAGRFAEAEADLRAVASAEDPGLRCRALNLLGMAAFQAGDIEQAEELLSRSVTEGARSEHPFLCVSGLLNRSTIRLHRGDPESARTHLQKASRIAERTGHLGAQRNVQGTLFTHCLWRGDLHRAEAAARRALTLSADGEFACALTDLGVVAILLGDYAHADDVLERANRALQRFGFLRNAALARVNQAELYVILGRLDEAVAAAAEAQGWSRQLGAALIEALALLASGRASIERQDPEQARLCFVQAAELTSLGMVRARCALGMGDLAWERGDLAQAESEYTRALAILQGSHRIHEALEAKARLAGLLACRGQTARAQALLEAARADSLGPWDEPVLTLVHQLVSPAPAPVAGRPAAASVLVRFLTRRLSH